VNPLKKLLSSFNFSGGSSESTDDVVGVDIGTSSIKLVQIKKKGGKAVLETYSTLSLGPYANLDIGATTNLAPEVLAKALADAVREGSITTRSAAFSIPSSASLVFIIELPANIEEKDFASIVPTEARKYIPVPITEVSLDYWVIPKHQDTADDSGAAVKTKTEVLVAAIHNETLQKYHDLAAAAGLSSDIFEIEVFSEIRSSFGHELSAVLLMDVGASRTKLAIVEYGVVRTFHIVNRGSFDITSNISRSLTIPFAKAEDMKREAGLLGTGEAKAASDVASIAVDFILSETSTIIQSFERKYNKPVSKILLSGAGALLPGLREHVAESLHIETFGSNPFDKVTVPAFVATVLAETGPEFSTSLGVALRKLG
jgi:type IV pilus assembly protein PilM